MLHLPFVFANTKPVVQNTVIAKQIVEPLDNTKKESCIAEVAVYDSLHLNDLGLSEQAFQYAVKGYEYLKEKGKINNESIISIVDFTKGRGQDAPARVGEEDRIDQLRLAARKFGDEGNDQLVAREPGSKQADLLLNGLVDQAVARQELREFVQPLDKRGAPTTQGVQVASERMVHECDTPPCGDSPMTHASASVTELSARAIRSLCRRRHYSTSTEGAGPIAAAA